MSDLAATRRGRSGYFLEDFIVGDCFQHPLGRTITEADNTWFTLLTMNTNQLHFNADYALRSLHGRQVVNSGFSIALLLGISVSDISQNAFANLGLTDIVLGHPLWIGDTLYGESMVVTVRNSVSRPWAGVVTVATRGLNQDGTEVLSFRRSAMIYKRDAEEVPRAFPKPTVGIRDRFALKES